jgi:ECF sigma factor
MKHEVTSILSAIEQAAECLGIAPRTADRAWRYARAWLYTAMAGSDSGEK